jgi:hypothetical protein
LLKIDPHLFLYSSILSWPTLSSTAEIALLKREGDEIAYLNELRHRKETALRFRLPLTKTTTGVKPPGKEEITRDRLPGAFSSVAARKCRHSLVPIAKIDLSVSAPRFYIDGHFYFAFVPRQWAWLCGVIRTLISTASNMKQSGQRDLAQQANILPSTNILS